MKQRFAKFMLLTTVILMDILGGAEVDLIVPSFPELQEHFGLSAFWVEMLLSANFVGFCGSLFFVGGLADRYGRKPIIISGLLIFILGSGLCLLGFTYSSMIIGRFLQGVGVAAPATLCFLIVADNYTLKQQQYLYALLNVVVNISVGLAPFVGSYVTLYFHWQGNFTTLLIASIIVLMMTIIFVPAHPRSEHKGTLSFRGYIPIFQSRPMVLMLVNMMFMFVPFWVFIGMTPLLYIKELGVSLEQFGYYQGSLAFSWAAGCMVSGWFIKKFDHKKLLIFSGVLCTFGLLTIGGVALMNIMNPLVITLAYFPFNLGVIFPAVIVYPIYINYLPALKGRAVATLTGGRLILTAIGLEAAGYFYAQSFLSTGLVLCLFFAITVVTLFQVIKTQELMEMKNEA